MTNAYITKREAPRGFVAVTRTLAQAIYDRDFQVILCGSEVNIYNVIQGEHRGYPVRKQTSTRPFPLIIFDYMQTLPKSLGQVCVFYAKSEDAHTVLKDITTKQVVPKTHRLPHAGRH